VDDRAESTGTNIYDSERTQRDVLFLAAGLKPGDSGSAVVDAEGRVVGIAFAIAPDRANVAYALAMSELDEVLTEPRSREVATGPCLG
jgi:S1-C subfamily serine protease